MFGRVTARALPLFLLGPLAVLALAPLVRGPMFASADGLFHLYRLVEFDRDIRAGMLYPRWAPDLMAGYGYPIFIFYAPFLYYLAELFHLLGLGFVDALKAAVATGMLASLAGMYVLGRDLWGRWGGLIAAAAYLYVPYRFVNTYLDGELAQTLAWAWLPWLLWACWRFLRGGGRRYGALAAVCLAGLVFTHSVGSWLGSMLVGVIVLGWLASRRAWWRRLPALLGFLAGGVALAAPYWLPALAEQADVQLNRVRVASYDFHTNFVPLSRTLSPDLAHDYAGHLGVNGPAQLGLAQVAVAIAGLLAVAGVAVASRVFRRKGEPVSDELSPKCARAGSFGQTAVFAVAAAACFVLMLAPAAPVWEHLPFGRFLQFPDRLLGPMAFCLALLAGGAGVLARRVPLWACASGAVLLMSLLVYGSVARLNVQYLAVPAQLTPADAVQYEQLSSTIGTTAKGEFTPRWMATPATVSALSGGYVTSPDPARQLPGGQTLADSPQRWRLRVTSAVARLLSLPVAYFPGWRATVNGAPVPAAPDANGQVQLPVPAGQADVDLRFGDTPDRWLADGLALAGLLAVAAGVVVGGPKLKAALSWRERELAGVAAGAGACALLLFLLPGKLQLGRWPAARPMDVDFPAGVMVLGADVTPASDGYTVTIPIRTGAGLQPGLTATAMLVTGDVVWSSASLPVQASGGQTRLAFQLPLAQGTPPGAYALQLDLGSANGAVLDHDPAALSYFTPVIGPVKMGMVSWTGPGQPGTGQPPANSDFGPLRLAGWQAPSTIRQGDFVPINLWWQPLERPAGTWKVSVRIEDGQGVVWAQHDAEPRDGYNPTSAWVPGQVQRDVQMVLLPGGMLPGDYTVTAGWYDASTMQGVGPQNVIIGRIHVDQAMREDVSKLGVPSPFDHQFEDGLELLGYDLPAAAPAAGEPLALRLFWRVNRPPAAGLQLQVGFDGRTAVVPLPKPDQWTAGELVETRLQVPVSGWTGSGELSVAPMDGSTPVQLPRAVRFPG